MSELPYLQQLFERLRRGWHLSPDDEPLFSAVAMQPDAYVDYLAPLGIKLVRHSRDFFYFEPESGETIAETLPRIAVFSYILIDHTANVGHPIEEYLLGQHFLISKLPHFTLDRYIGMLRQVEVDSADGLRQVLKNMERYGWVKFFDSDEFKFLRPFHRVFDKCLELAAELNSATQAESLPPNT